CAQRPRRAARGFPGPRRRRDGLRPQTDDSNGPHGGGGRGAPRRNLRVPRVGMAAGVRGRGRRAGAMNQKGEAPKTVLQRLLDVVERVGNKVPPPAVLFFLLIAVVVLLSHALRLTGTSASYQRINPETH